MIGSLPRNFLDSIPGQETAKTMLYRAIESDRLASAYLFRGPAGVGKLASAMQLVSWLKCKSSETCIGECNSCKLIKKLNHPDLELLVPLPKKERENPEMTAIEHGKIVQDPFVGLSFDKPANITIEQVRTLTEWLSLSPTSAGGRWAIIRDAESMTIEASNAFLKTLEEPPEDSHIILTSSQPDYLLPTIRSRAQPIAFSRLSREQIRRILISRGIEETDAETAAYYADGSISTAIEYLSEESGEIVELAQELWVAIFSKNDTKALDFVDKIGRNRSKSLAVMAVAISILRDHMLYQIGAENIVANQKIIDRLEVAARKFPNPEPIGKALKYLEKRAYQLRHNPQYDLFWMATIITAREYIYQEVI